MIKKRIIQAVLISVFATLGLAKFAAAANVQVDTTAKVKICYNFHNIYQSYQLGAFDSNISVSDTGVTRSGWPATNNQSITYVSGTHDYSMCQNYYLNNITPGTGGLDMGGTMYFTDNTPRRVTVDFNVSANMYSSSHGFTNAATHYYATVELHNTVDSSGNITGQEAVLLHVKNASGTKVNQLDYDFTAGITPSNIRLKKTVKGSAGDTNKLFKFTVNIGGSTGATYSINGTTGTGSASSCTANTNCVIYLKHGGDIRIGYNGTSSEIPEGVTYSITEGDNSGYTTTFTVGSIAAVNTGSTTGNLTLSATAADNVIAFTNRKDTTPDTGLFTNILPYIAFAGISILGVIIVKKHKVKGAAQ